MIVLSLTKLFNKSFGSAKVPKLWKEANIIPLHKKGHKDDVNNYRPVSLLPCVGKILETIVFKKLYNYYLDHDTLSSHQSSFRPGDSTVNQLAHLYHVFAQALYHKKCPDSLLCDISNAFDRSWHNF